jgi:FRG domain
METLGVATIYSFMDGTTEAAETTNSQIRKGLGFKVNSYLDLAAKIAELQYRNRDHVLLFRGQAKDYRTPKGSTTLRASIFRPPSSTLSKAVIETRYKTLHEAERLLAEGFQAPRRHLGRQNVKRQQILRWSILQHYEVCPTPLLDVTHSLRIAASFASDGASGEVFLLVLAVPALNGVVTASAEAQIQIIRLASVCPPAALRPHLQEGYLLGEYPELVSAEQKSHYKHYETDFGRRLIAKFRFDVASLWGDPHFPPVGHDALYPKGRDWLEILTANIVGRLP